MASTLYVNSSWSSCSADDPIPFGDDILTFGTNAFADIKSAVDAASTTETNTINLVSGEAEAVTQVLTYNPIPDTTNLFVDDDWASCAPGDPVVIGDKIYIIGRDAFADIQSAVNAASATEKTTISVFDGTYGGDVCFLTDVVGEQKADIDIVAAAGNTNAVVTGTFYLGNYVKGVGNSHWNAKVAINGIDFDNDDTANDNATSLSIEDLNGLTVTNCDFSGDATYRITIVAGCPTPTVEFEECTFDGGYLNLVSGQSVSFDSCTMTEVNTNIQGGNGVEFTDCTFSKTLTDDYAADSFYVVRTNDVPLTLDGCTFDIDSTATASAPSGAGKDWGVLWQRKAGSRTWTVSDVTVNYTAAAAASTGLKFNINDTTTAANASSRITIDGIEYNVNGSAADVDDLLDKTAGYLVVTTPTAAYLYDDGDVVARTGDTTLYADGSWAGKSMGEAITLPDSTVVYYGFNAFSSILDAGNAAQPGVATTVHMSGNLDAKANISNGQNITFTGTAALNWKSDWFFVGRGISGADRDAVTYVTFRGATITSINPSTGFSSTGFHVSGYDSTSSSTNYGVLNIIDSTMECDYLLNRNVVNISNSDVTFVNMYTHGRSASQSKSGEDETASLNLTNGAHVTVTHNNGMPLGGEGKGLLTIDGSTFEHGDASNVFTVSAKGEIQMTGSSSLIAAKGIANNGTITADGTATFNIATLTGNDIELTHGTSVTNSTVGGGVELLGEVSFVGNNRVTMVYDFGKYTGAQTGHDTKLIVGAGNSLTMTSTSRYGIGYGDAIDIDGAIVDALTARATLTESDASLTINGGMALQNGGWSYVSTMTVDNAYVILAKNNGYISTNTTKGGNYNFTFTNSVVDATRIHAQAAGSYVNITFSGSDVKFSGVYNIASTGSTTTLTNTVMTVNGTNGNDQKNTNAGTFTMTGSTVTFADAFTNTGSINIDATSLLTGTQLTNTNGAITIDGSNLAANTAKKVIDLDQAAALTNVTVTENVKAIYGDDGDVFVHNISMETLYVNAAWATGYAFGDEITLADETKVYFGINAFANVDDVFALYGDKEHSNTETTTVQFLSNVTATATGKKFLYSDVDILFTAASDVVVDMTSYDRAYMMHYYEIKQYEGAPTSVPNFTIDDHVTFRAKLVEAGQVVDSGDVYKEDDPEVIAGDKKPGDAKRDPGAANIIVNGRIEAKQTNARPYSTITTGKNGVITTHPTEGGSEMVIRSHGEIDINGDGSFSTVQFSPNYVSNQGGTLKLKDAKGITGSLIMYNAKSDLDSFATNALIELDNSKLYSYTTSSFAFAVSTSTRDTNVTLTLKNGSELSGISKTSEKTGLGMNGTNKGTINVEGASKLVLGTVSNTGSINVIGKDNTVTATALSGAGSVTFKNAALDNKISLAGTQGGVRFLGTTSIADPNLALTATFYVGSYGLDEAVAENSELTINNDVTFNGNTYVGADADGASGKTATLDIAAGKTLTVKQFYTRASSQITVNAGSKLLTEYANLKSAITVNGGVAQFESVCGKENSITADNGVIDLGLIQSYYNAGQTYTLTNGSILTVDRILDNNVAITMDSSSILALAPEKANLSNLAIKINVASAFTGVKKLIDMNARYDYTTGEYTTAGYGVTMTVDDYKNIVTDWNDNFTVIDNDLYLANVDVDEVYVNSDWATGGYSYGDAIEGETGKFYGINAFDKVATAYAALSSGGTIHLEDGTSTYELGTKIKVQDGKGFTITGNAAPVDIRTVSMDEDTGDLYVISTDSKNNTKTVLFSGTVIPIFSLGVEDKDHPAATMPASVMNVTGANHGYAELDARSNATINVSNSTLTDHGGNSIIKSYFNGAVNITNSVIWTMQSTTTGVISVSGSNSKYTSTWQTTVWYNGQISVSGGATWNTAAIRVGSGTEASYAARKNPDIDANAPATITVNASTLNVGTGVINSNGASYDYNATVYGIRFGTDSNTKLDILNKSTATLFMNTSSSKKNYLKVQFGQYAIVTVDDSVLTVGGGASAENFLNEGSLTLSNDATLNATIATVNTGTIALDVTSAITGTTLDNANGAITIDATAFTTPNTLVKVIDLSQNAALTNVGFKDGTAAEGVKLAYGADGDVVVHNISAANLYVNAAWATGYSIGDEITLADSTKVYYGINAFSRMEDVTDKIATDGSDTTVHILSDLTPDDDLLEFQYGDGNVSFVKDGDEPVSVAFAKKGDFVFETATEATITIGEGVTFSTYDNNSDFAVFYGPSLSVYGTISGGANFGALYVYDGDHKVHTTGTIGTGRIHMWNTNLTIYGIEGEGADLKRRYDADVAVADRSTDAQADVNFLFLSSGTFTASDTYITVGDLTTGGDGHGIYDTNKGKVQSTDASIFNLTNTKVETYRIALSKADTEFSATGSVINVTGASSNTTGASFSNASSITLDKSTLSAIDIANAGTINVYGTSKISAGGYSGSGSLVFGKIGTTTEITTDGLNASSGDVFIADGASATLTGNGFNLHYIMDSAEKKNSEGHTGYTLTIKDADEFTAYALYPNGNSVINVNNVKYLKTVYFNVYGGTLNLNGTDKTVNTAGWLNHSSGSSTAQVTGVMNVDKTALTVGTIKVLPADGGKLGGTLNATSASLRARYYSVGVAPSSSEADYTTGTNQSALMKLNASEMTLANTDGEPDYAYLKIGSDTYYGTVTMENSTLVQNETEKGQFESPRVMIGAKGTLNIESNSSVTVDIIENAGTITIDGTGSINSAVSITNTGSINITVGGTITAETFTNGGTITIDARDFTGYADVITVTGGDAQMAGTINLIKDEGSKLDVIKHANGSVSVGVVGDDIYFNKAWSTLADGASISVDSGTKTVHKGVDAFAELSDFTATAGKTLHFTSESASTAAVNGMLDGSELVKAQDAADDVTVTIANGTTFFQQKGDLTIGAGVTLAATKLMHFAKDTTITVDGTFQADDNAYLYAGKMIVNGSLTGDDVFLNGSGTNSYELTANGAIDVAKLRVGANATLKLAGGNVTTTQGMFVTAATGTVNVNNHASIEGGLTNAGTINVADSKALSLTGAVDNSGKINLAAGSTLVSDMITNTNAINGNSGAIEADSIINGASDGSVKGTITAATLNADSIVNNNGAAKKGGSSIELTGDLEAGTITNGVAPIVPGTDEPADKALIKAANITAGSITNFGTIGSQTSELEHTLDTIELTGGLDNGQYGNVMADKLFAASLDNYNEVLVNNINIDGVINNYAGAAIALNGGEGSTGHIDIEAASVSNAGYIKTLSGGSIKVTGNLFNDTYAELTGDLEKGLIETDSIVADTVTNNGKIDVKVSMDIDGSVTNNASGTINLASGATLDAAAVANNGTINVFGAGKVNSEITGTGKVTFEDATVDGFASTGNDAVFYGDSNLTGEVKFNAASYIQGYDGYLNTEDSTVTVSNGSLTARNFYVGSNKLGDVTNTLVADNAQILSDAPSNTTTFYVRCYGEMELTNGSQLGNTPGNVVNMMNYGSVTLTDSTAYLNGFVVYGGDINDTDGADGFTTATFTAIGSTIDVRGKYGSKFTIVDGFTTSVVVGGKSSKGDGIVNLSDSTFTVGNNEVTADLAIGFAKDGTVNVNDGSTLTVTGTIGIGLAAGTGTLTVDATSTVTANAITFGDNGSINLTIDAADLTEASYTLIDITGTQALDTAKITVNGEAFADGATYGNYTLKLWDGDVMLFKTPVADTTTLYVSESYTGYYGQEVAEGKYYGINAFDNLVDAFDSRKDDTVAVNLDDVSSIASTGKKEWVISQDTTISGNNAATVDLAGSDFRFYANDEDAEHIKTLTIDEDVTINLNGTNGNTATFYIGRNSGEFAGMDATINGTLNVDQFYSAYGSQVTMTGKLKTKGALMMHGATNENNANKVIQRNGVVVFDGTGKEYSADNLQVNVPSYLGLFGGDMTFKNTFAKFGGEIHLYNYKDIAEGPRSLTLDNANVTGKTLTVADNATVTLVNGSTLKVNNSGTVDATSTITVTASTFEAASLNTAGTFTVSGTSLLTIDTLTGTITVNDDATLTGSSVVGGSIAVAAGKVLTVGDTTKTATSFGAVTNAGEIDIDGASVNLGAITNNGTINMDWNDKLTFSGYDGTGLVNINMTGYRSTASGTVMDYIGGGTMDAGKYMDMTGMDAVEFNKYFTVSNNDLVLKSSIVVPTDAYPVGQVKKAVADAKANGENLTLNDAQYTVAALGDSKYLELDDVNTTVNGGTFDVHVNGGTIVDLEDEDDSGKIGTKTAPVNTSVTINDGTFNKTVTGADRFNEGASIIRYGNSELTINGGTFNSVVAGGMLYAQESSGSAKIRGDVTLTINGGSFANFVYGGSFAGKKLMASCTSIDVLDSTTGTGGNVTIAIDATNAGKNGISFGKDLVLGSHGTGKVKKDAKLIFSGSGTITVTGQIWGSSSGDYYIIKADGTRTIDTSIEGDRLLSFTGFTGALVCDRIRGFESFAAIDSDFDLSGAVSLSDIHNWEIGDSTIGGAFVSDFTGDTLTLTSLKSGVIFEDVSRFQLTKTEDGITTSLFKAVQYKVADNDFVAMNFDGASEWASADNKYRLYLSDNADGKTEMMFELA